MTFFQKYCFALTIYNHVKKLLQNNECRHLNGSPCIYVHNMYSMGDTLLPRKMNAL